MVKGIDQPQTRSMHSINIMIHQTRTVLSMYWYCTGPIRQRLQGAYTVQPTSMALPHSRPSWRTPPKRRTSTRHCATCVHSLSASQTTDRSTISSLLLVASLCIGRSQQDPDSSDDFFVYARTQVSLRTGIRAYPPGMSRIRGSQETVE